MNLTTFMLSDPSNMTYKEEKNPPVKSKILNYFKIHIKNTPSNC